MGLVSRGPWALGVLALAALMAGCGGSVADSDSPAAPRSAAAAPTSPFCRAVQANSDAIRPLNGLAQRGAIPADQLPRTVEAVRQTGMDMVNLAPAEIRGDVQSTVDAWTLQLDALVRAGGDVAAVSRDPQLAAKLSSPELAGAGQRVAAYVTRTCTPAGR